MARVDFLRLDVCFAAGTTYTGRTDRIIDARRSVRPVRAGNAPTSDWQQPLRSARPLAFAAIASAVAFGALYAVEHYR